MANYGNENMMLRLMFGLVIGFWQNKLHFEGLKI